MRRSLIAVVSAALVLTACASRDGEITVAGDEPVVNLRVTCGQGDVTSVSVQGEATLVGVGAGVEVLGGVPYIDDDFRLYDDADSVTLVVDVAPTSGECRVTLTDEGTGEQLSRESRGDAEFTLRAHLERS